MSMTKAQAMSLSAFQVSYQLATRVLGWEVDRDLVCTVEGRPVGVRLLENPTVAVDRVAYFLPSQRPGDIAVVESLIERGRAPFTAKTYIQNLRDVLQLRGSAPLVDTRILTLMTAPPAKRCLAVLMSL